MIRGNLILISTFAIAVAACATRASESQDADSALEEGTHLSPIGTAVRSALEGGYAKRRGSTWGLSFDNAFDTSSPNRWLVELPLGKYWGQAKLPVATTCDPAHDSGCDPDFALYACTNAGAACDKGGACTALDATVAHAGAPPKLLCVSHSDSILDDLYRQVLAGQQYVDVTSLTAPDGRFEAALRNAITRLSERKAPPQVRLLFGTFPGRFESAKDVLASLTRDVPKDSRVKVAVALQQADLMSWNHSKIVAVDGKQAVVGGMNLWTEHYLEKNPVHDVGVRVMGGAAADAHRFANRLWEAACKDSQKPGIASFPTGAFACPTPFSAPASTATGGVPILAVGRVGAIDAADQPADAAIVALVGSAATSIKIAQQDIGPPRVAGKMVAPWPKEILGAVAKALANGVDVQIVMSTPNATPGDLGKLEGTYSHGYSLVDVGRPIEDELARVLPGDDNVGKIQQILCDHVHLTTARASESATWADGAGYALHSKVIVVDDAAFYVGSQNVYTANLAEFGYIVDDAETTKRFVASYYDKLWTYSKSSAITGSGVRSCGK